MITFKFIDNYTLLLYTREIYRQNCKKYKVMWIVNVQPIFCPFIIKTENEFSQRQFFEFSFYLDFQFKLLLTLDMITDDRYNFYIKF